MVVVLLCFRCSFPPPVAQSLVTDWSPWHILWADERCVPLSDEDSNYRAALASCPAMQHATLHPMMIKSESGSEQLAPEVAADAYAKMIKELCSEEGEEQGAPPQIDMILLGMGPDGHCCSLFPGHELLEVGRGRALVSIHPLIYSSIHPSL